jgi:hypothetical protein
MFMHITVPSGVSKNALQGPKGFAARSLNIWMGPGFMVPHMMLTIGTCADGSCDSCTQIIFMYLDMCTITEILSTT